MGLMVGMAAIMAAACSRPEEMGVQLTVDMEDRMAAAGSRLYGVGEEPTVRIVAGAASNGGEADSRVAYDEERGRLLWTEGDRMAVASFEEGGRVSEATGVRWRCFSQAEGSTFDPEYMLFAGDALRTAPEAVHQELYAFYPYELLEGLSGDTFLFPAVQRRVAGSFDPTAVVMCSAPLPVDLPEAGTVEASAFRLRHHTGYLKLIFADLPAEAAAETVSAIELSMAGQPAAGRYEIRIDGESGNWEFVPTGEVTDRVTVDFSENPITVGQLAGEACWFVLMPDLYETLTITIRTTSGGTLTMVRNGLPIRSGVVQVPTIHFREGDSYAPAQVMTLDGTVFDFGALYSNKTAVVDGVSWTCERGRAATDTDGSVGIDLATKTGKLYNTIALPGAIVRVEIDFKTELAARYTEVTIGATPDGGTAIKGTAAGVNTFVPQQEDARYLRIAHTGTMQSAVIRSVRIYMQ